MSSLSTNEVAKIADLAKIKLSETEETQLAELLSTALDASQVLAELNTKDVASLSHPTGLTTAGVEDEPVKGLSTNDALLNATANGNAVMGYIKVSRSN